MRFQSRMAKFDAVPSFPQHTGERVYMVPFTKAVGLPADLRRWQDVVDVMMEKVDTDQMCFIMIDQGFVQPDKALRRHGIHIDGYWDGSLQAHGGSSDTGGWRSTPSSHRSTPLHRPASTPRHRATSRHMSGADDWSQASFDAPEAILLASDLEGCIGYTGEFEGPIGDMGCCDHVDLSALSPHTLAAHRTYAGNVTFLHESVPLVAGPRTLVRINAPGWTV